MKKIATIITSIVLSIIGLGFITVTDTYAANVTNICATDAPDEVKAANGCPGSSSPELKTVVVNILNGIIGALGVVAVVVIVIGGINYMTSAGDAGKVEKAKKTILYAAIGLIVCALAFAIVNFAIGIINNAES